MKYRLLLILLLFSGGVSAQNVAIIDTNFLTYLIGAGVDANNDDTISVAEALAVTDLNINSANDVFYIHDLTGIEEFKNLVNLRFAGHKVTSVFLGGLSNLEFLDCSSNDLLTLDVSGLTSLENLNCSNNNLVGLTVGNLKSLDCSHNRLFSISMPSSIEVLDVSYNDFAVLPLQTLINLVTVDLGHNPLVAIEPLFCENLSSFFCDSTAVEILDLSYNGSLSQSIVTNNPHLNELNARNGNNKNQLFFNAGSNESLFCITVDTVVPTGHLGWAFSSWTQLNENCDTVYDPIQFESATFKNLLLANTAINTNGDGEIDELEAASYTGSIDVSGQGITDLTGIEMFTSLTSLSAYNNQITSLDVSALTELTVLDIERNQLTTLDVSQNTKLEVLYANNNQLTSLDLSANPELIFLTVYENSLSGLDVSTNVKLRFLYAYSATLSSIDLSSNTALQIVSLYDNQLTSLDLSSNTSIVNLLVQSNQLESLVVNSPVMSDLYAFLNELDSIDLSMVPNLDTLHLAGNNLTELDVSNNTQLAYLHFQDNAVESLDASMLSSLHYFVAINNNLSELDFANGNNLNLTGFSTADNANLTCISVDDPVWAELALASLVDSWTSFSTDCGVIASIAEELNGPKVYADGQTVHTKNFSGMVNVTDVNGRLVKTVEAPARFDLKQGVYMVTLHSEEVTKTEKIVIQ